MDHLVSSITNETYVSKHLMCNVIFFNTCSGSRSPLVNWAALELKLPLQAGDLSKNPHPFGQIPCLTDDNDVLVFESGAILNYLQSKADGKGINDSRTAAIASWIAWANASLDPICFLETPQGKV
jgi:glutathione S-transferase